MTTKSVTENTEIAQGVLPKHETIFEAIASAAREVRVIGKSERNKFDGYDFASIDKFLMLVNPICSRNGLFPIVAQRDVEFYENVNSKGGKSVWARFFYDITLYHSTGSTLGPINIMVSVPMNGAQATGSAQSYALKQFFRSTLMIPTGDKDDADLNPTEVHQRPTLDEKHKETPRRAPTWAETIINELPESATPRDKAMALAKALCDQWGRMKGEKQIGLEWDRRVQIIESLEAKHPDLHETVVDAYENRMNEIKEQS